MEEKIRTIPDFPRPGIQYKDISPLLADPRYFALAIDALVEDLGDYHFEMIAGIEARGFIFASALALKCQKGLVMLRKADKLPGPTSHRTYALEYGQSRLEIQSDAFPPNTRLLVVDDILATGGTVQAACQLIEQQAGQVAACAGLLELKGLAGREKVKKYPLVFLREVRI